MKVIDKSSDRSTEIATTIIIISFLEEIGLQTVKTSISNKTFLPGIHVEKGVLYYDPEKLEHPGDLLHEAGHMACLAPCVRNKIYGKIDHKTAADFEIGAILWSFLACSHLKLPPEVVFHEKGYKGDANWLIENFQNGNYIGSPVLKWLGLIEYDENKKNKTSPTVISWLRKN
ncbi:hypothetical protein RM553_05055 [Zunongwangia sp. F363]|uniref:Uncharacterized protein n=1 Tax=Autumnicola tepida TaxID=3075595 RepID=A0ABU3C7A7_9FLAO|nr:hypothetical protein [Zunongwangia sp. F363]MDT0642196.1 hypothetical protein [Zunongwangia sp. F363]